MVGCMNYTGDSVNLSYQYFLKQNKTKQHEYVVENVIKNILSKKLKTPKFYHSDCHY